MTEAQPYAGPPPPVQPRRDARNRGWSVISLLLLVVDLTVLVGLLVMVYFQIPRFAEVFEGMGAELPAVTRGVLWLAATPLPAVAALLLAAGVIVKEVFFPPKVSAVINAGLLIAAGAGVLLITLAVFLPMYHMTEQVGGRADALQMASLQALK